MKDGKKFSGERMYTIGSPQGSLTIQRYGELYSKFTIGILPEVDDMCNKHFHPITLSPQLPNFLSLFEGKSHLASVVTQESDNGSEKKHYDKIDRRDFLEKNFWAETPPKDKDNFEDEEKN
jgi:hypothetical protein